MIFDVPFLRRGWVRKVVPTVIVLLMGYGSFLCYYSIGYSEIWRFHSHGVAIEFWCLIAICQCCIAWYWVFMFVIGPGRAPKFNLFDLYQTNIDRSNRQKIINRIQNHTNESRSGELTNSDQLDFTTGGDLETVSSNSSRLITVPDIFVCDQYGFPYYDSHTQSMTLSRSFYLKQLGYLVLKYDHYCVWVGTVIGQSNYLFFLKFMIWFWFFFVVAFVHLIRYTPSNVRRGEINHNFILGYILCVFWLLMLSGLLFVHLRYVVKNMTTLDEMTENQAKRYAKWMKKKNKDENRSPRKENGIRFVNVAHDNIRLVVPYDIKQGVFNMGFKKNWINLIFNGNRNHGYRGGYGSGQLVLAFLVFLCPFIDTYFAFKYNQVHLDDAESAPDLHLAKYMAYSSQFNEKFMDYVKTQIENKQCHLPLYIKIETEKATSDETRNVDPVS